jgi:cell division protein ZapA
VNAKTTSVKVNILGEEYAIRSDASADHTRAVAQYVDRTIRSVMNSGMVVESHKAAILAALQLTDELFRLRAAQSELAAEMRALAADVRRWLPPSKRSGGSG